MRVAVIGGGVSGLGSAYCKELVLFEKEDSLGGHARTMRFDVTHPNMMGFLKNLEVDMEDSDMSFSVSLDNGRGYEWDAATAFQACLLRRETFSIHDQRNKKVQGRRTKISRRPERNLDNNTLGEFLKSHGYSDVFQKAYLIWSGSSESVLNLSAYSVLSFCFVVTTICFSSLGGQRADRCRTFSDFCGKGSKLLKLLADQVRAAELEKRGCKIITNCNVQSVATSENGCVIVTTEDGSQQIFDSCILAVHAPDALKLLGDKVTYEETRVLGAFQYTDSDLYLHRDTDLMPRKTGAWSAWNFLGTSVTYWLNIIQKLGEEHDPFFITVNPEYTPKKTLFKWTTSHPVPSVSTWKASQELYQIQGKRGIWFCGAYQGYGFHEEGLKALIISIAGMAASQCLLGKDMVTNFYQPETYGPICNRERGSKFHINRIHEEGGTVFTFEGKDSSCHLKSILEVHSPQFYWKERGLLDLIMGWWTPMFLTASLASANNFLKHFSRQNTLTQARRNISRHYDLSNELFALFLDDTMTYSSAVFKSVDEDLRTAQMRKIYLLIDKARIEKNHEVLEIGCGWGTLAIEVVKRTGCKYTGITLSIEQLKYAEEKVKEAGLEDRIKFKLCDYRQLSDAHKYDRIISCEMLEAVGHEFMETFFRHCEAALAEDGIFVLQFISIPEERYDEYRLSSDFIKEYIFPGGCLPSLARVTSAMASSSRLCIENVENIGIHYYQTLRLWRKTFLERQKQINDLGFDDKFIRTWEYYFDYCAAGFKTLTLGNYQVVFSRPGNVAALGDPFRSFPSAQV
ncbi:LOW QUALITY PROTEIN: hypothetical protein HID58_013731 [Brassica napus]|uniref:Amine oxidase domain-containing protein n=1 Tax=Brassica napus TaxID=3708 RepID=A0ABQ7XH54_BRANA|nr:LOW QUALITY PROTEIN: hypothetical protein HID58_013731 [Brassica napus]